MVGRLETVRSEWETVREGKACDIDIVSRIEAYTIALIQTAAAKISREDK